MANNYQFWDLGGLAMDVPGGNTTPGAAILQIYQQNQNPGFAPNQTRTFEQHGGFFFNNV